MLSREWSRLRGKKALRNSVTVTRRVWSRRRSKSRRRVGRATKANRRNDWLVDLKLYRQILYVCEIQESLI